MRSPSHRFRRIFRAKSEAKAKSENRPRCRAKSESRPRWKNPDLGGAQARQAGGSDAGQVRRNCRIRRQFRIFFPGKNPDLGMPGRRGREAMPGRNVARQALGEPVLTGRAIKQGPYSLGEPVLGEPSNEVGRASTKGPLGEPVLIGRASTHWASPYSLGEPLNHFHSGQRLPLLGAVPARHCACSARLVKCLLGTASACSARSVPTYKCPLGTSTYKCPLGTSTYKCPLGTAPARHVKLSARSALRLLGTFS